MQMSNAQYSRYVQSIAPKSKSVKNCLNAFWTGGLICLLGQGLMNLYSSIGLEKTASATFVSISLVLLSAILTGFAIYDDIAKFAGAPTETFRQGNLLASWYYFLGECGYHLNTLGYCDIPDEDKQGSAREKSSDVIRFGGLDGDELSGMVQLSHRSVLGDIMKKRETDPTVIPVTIASIPQIRMTRRIVGEYTLSTDEDHKRFDDSVGMVSNWKKRGPVYEVPFGTLYSSEVRNLITAGRCTSVSEGMWDIMRVIPCCAVTGQAAGTAAALTDDFTSLDVCRLQDVLRAHGAVIHLEEIGL